MAETMPAPSHSLDTAPQHAMHQPHGTLPNTPLASSLIAFLLGSTFSLGALLWLAGGIEDSWWAKYQLGFYIAAWAGFHWGEFAVTAGWNLEKCSIDSYLLNNGVAYHLANGTAVVEFLITSYFFPKFKTYPYITEIGIVMTLIGQWLRSAAMITASTNFSHTVAWQKLEKHKLVTHGVYGWFRHPSYTGYFYWGLGTQLALQNPLSFVLFFVALWRFFNSRIKAEERFLTKFFGNEYVQYRKTVGTMIPFIP
ncbi:hypothetical protein FRC02_004026 [Tulasnella sp. 418]|nr:hypothetical protein FRC02_004026 [Tulasnella sp. 418]